MPSPALLCIALLAGCLGKVPMGAPPPAVGIVASRDLEQGEPRAATGVLSEHSAEGYLAVVDEAGERVAVVAMEAIPTGRLGQEVTAEVSGGEGGWGGPADQSAAVWDADGTLLFASASGLRLRSGLPGGIELSPGPGRRTVRHTCGRRRVRSAVVSVGDDRARVPPGRSRVIGDYRVTLTTLTEQVGESQCMDWGGDAAIVWASRIAP